VFKCPGKVPKCQVRQSFHQRAKATTPIHYPHTIHPPLLVHHSSAPPPPSSPSSARHSALFPPAIELLFSIQKVHRANLVAGLITFPSPKILPPACIQNEPLHHPEGNYSAAPCIFLDAGHLRRYAAQALAIRLIPRRPTFFDSLHYRRLNKRHQPCCVIHARK
jgi:hypothetical protein